MSQPSILVENLSKRYQLGVINRHTLGEEIEHLARKFTRKRPSRPEGEPHAGAKGESREFWALRDVSFEVNPGEVMGVIGGNGAGKSTLLKILSRITEPTSGRAFIRGRVGSLLEVGTGFHPELTGRENVFMNGTLLGMKRHEIATRFDDILEFSEIGKFIDTPVKRYSSGMYVRLAFAVAAHLEPEILIVDEVLAVGDASFQKKCLGKMGEAVGSGRTILFVSHNLAAVNQLCQRSLYLQNGRLVTVDATSEIIDQYLQDKTQGHEGRYEASRKPGDNPRPHLLKASVLNAVGVSKAEVDYREPFRLEIDLDLGDGFPDGTVFSVSLKDMFDRRLSTLDFPCERLRPARGLHTLRLEFPGGLVYPGSYQFLFMLHVPNRTMVELVANACPFHLGDTGGGLSKYRCEVGVFHIPATWKITTGKEGG